MKRKITLFCLMILSLISISTASVMAYSPHYLPGGTNYLSKDNFEYDTSIYYSTIENFLVKPYTTYTLTLPLGYAEEQFSAVEVVMFDNGIELDTLELTSGMFDSADGNWFYESFVTTAETNYLSITFEDGRGYFAEGSAHEIQLEEGEEFTGFEPYIEGELIDTSAPYFQNSGSVISYYDSPITINEIQSALTAYDSIDGDVTNEITVVSDGYTANMDTLGIYSCVFEVFDSAGNSSQATIEVEVVDVLKPLFSELGTIQAVYPNSYSTSDITNMLSASDNYDGDISNQIVLVEDYYSENSTTVGTYEMEFEVTDSSGNTQSYIQSIEVVDDESPIITGVTTVSVGYDEIVTQAQILENLDYTDNYDSQIDLEIILDNDTYTDNRETLGIYEMVFSVTDSSGNKTSQSVSISVIDEIGPMVYFNSSIIQTYTDTVMDLPDFTQLLINTNEIDGDLNYYVTVKYDSYTRNSNVPGTYHLKLNLVDDLGEEYNKDLEIHVIDRPIDYIHFEPQEIDVNETVFDDIRSYIIGGIFSFLLVVSNIVWVVVLKKKS